ncbi:MAG: urease accessory protein UreE [Campylobacteraceae bacterium]|jgi:urease accessory protein|nr:urease accessory protein UreE [Campylobacteraceae bacterium]
MIKKIVKIEHNTVADDTVSLSWFDKTKPNLASSSEKGVSFVVRADIKHLHENDVFVAEDGYKIAVKWLMDDVFILNFKNALDFARCAYEVGNRHLSICIEDMQITILAYSTAEGEIAADFAKNPNVTVSQKNAYFKPNTKAHHEH